MGRKILRLSWDWVQRLVFIYLLLGIFLLSLPRPEKVAVRKRWETRKTRREFDRWASMINVFGFDFDHEDVDAVLWPIAKNMGAAVREFRKPYRWMIRDVGFFQSWRMFSVPNIGRSALLLVELDHGDGRGFVPIYRPRSNEFDWRRKFFDHDRIRKYVGRGVKPARGKYYRNLGRWIAEQAAEDFPDAYAVRVTALHGRMVTPEQWKNGRVIKYRRRNPKVYVLNEVRQTAPSSDQAVSRRNDRR
jgi:hypothetical protein